MSGPRVKTISLDDETWPIAQAMPNFSRFCRECLIRYYAATGGELHCGREARDDGYLCNPHATPRCIVCWPAGPPDREDWIQYYMPAAETTRQGIHQTTVEEGYFHERSKTYIEARQAGDRYTIVIPEGPHHRDHDWITARALESNPKLFEIKDIPISGNAPKTQPRPKPKKGPFQLITGILSPRKKQE